MHPAPRPSLRDGLDELVIEALAMHQQPLVPAPHACVEIEVVWEAGQASEVAETNQFVRESAPYERVELVSTRPAPRARPTRFVTTVPATSRQPSPRVTMTFDSVWFDQPDEAIAAIDDVPVPRRTGSWRWLGASLLAAILVIGIVQYAL